ncbi:MAG TPA: ProQ/FinO family protein, partial [Burkholderiaceae bacterium]|nr:ProQ/FinO family protein [Burkholderiaceae bacterium]
MPDTPAPPTGDDDAALEAPATPAAPEALAPAAAAAQAKPAPSDPAQTALQLKQRFPALFVGSAKPLKLRIQLDIQERAPGVFTKQALSAFFRRHTGSTSYLIAVSRATQRFDLDGQPAGELSAEHKQAALDELARRRANQVSRQEVEESQRRARAGLLHDFQTTTLTTANFCALKGVPPDELDGLLELARNEAQERAQESARHAPPPMRHARDDRGGP